MSLSSGKKTCDIKNDAGTVVKKYTKGKLLIPKEEAQIKGV